MTAAFSPSRSARWPRPLTYQPLFEARADMVERRRCVALERAAAPRQAGVAHEVFVRGERLVQIGNVDAFEAPFAVHVPALRLIVEVRDHDLVEYLLV